MSQHVLLATSTRQHKLSVLHAIARLSVRLSVTGWIIEQESRAAARKPREATAVLFGCHETPHRASRAPRRNTCLGFN